VDDYHAKLRGWAEHPVVPPPSFIVRGPPFRAKRFSSYAEMNTWKKAYQLEIGRAGGPDAWTE